MNREQAINYLYSSGYNKEQVKAIEDAFIVDVLDKLKEDIKELANFKNIDVLVEVARIIDKAESEGLKMSDLIERQAAIDALRYAQHRFTVADEAGGMGTVKWSEDVIYFAAAERVLSELPSAQPERKKMSNKEWVDFLSEQFTVSRTSAREMFHGLMRWKAEDNFKKQFSGGRNESRRR